MLEGFQLHLGNISSEIHSLQQQSMQMNVKLKNRQVRRQFQSVYLTCMKKQLQSVYLTCMKKRLQSVYLTCIKKTTPDSAFNMHKKTTPVNLTCMRRQL